MTDTRYPDAGDPRRHGYVRCSRCNVWRRQDGVTGPQRTADAVDWHCADAAVCTRMAGHGKGQLDADTGAK